MLSSSASADEAAAAAAPFSCAACCRSEATSAACCCCAVCSADTASCSCVVRRACSCSCSSEEKRGGAKTGRNGVKARLVRTTSQRALAIASRRHYSGSMAFPALTICWHSCAMSAFSRAFSSAAACEACSRSRSALFCLRRKGADQIRRGMWWIRVKGSSSAQRSARHQDHFERQGGQRWHGQVGRSSAAARSSIDQTRQRGECLVCYHSHMLTRLLPGSAAGGWPHRD